MAMIKDIADEPLVDSEEPRKLVGLSKRAFWDLVNKHGAPRYVLNQRVVRFRLTEFKAWLESRKIGGPTK